MCSVGVLTSGFRNIVPSSFSWPGTSGGIINIPAFTIQMPIPMGTIRSGSSILLYPKYTRENPIPIRTNLAIAPFGPISRNDSIPGKMCRNSSNISNIPYGPLPSFIILLIRTTNSIIATEIMAARK